MGQKDTTVTLLGQATKLPQSPDEATLERVPKDSFYWYRDFIAASAPKRSPSPIATG